MLKDQLFKTDCSLTTGFSGPKSSSFEKSSPLEKQSPGHTLGEASSLIPLAVGGKSALERGCQSSALLIGDHSNNPNFKKTGEI